MSGGGGDMSMWNVQIPLLTTNSINKVIVKRKEHSFSAVKFPTCKLEWTEALDSSTVTS